jgi:hypothetical protein
MKKRIIIGAACVAIIVLSVTALLVNSQLSSMQLQISQLQKQNSDLQNQVTDLQNKTSNYEKQNNARQEQLNSLTTEIAKQRPLHVKILEVDFQNGFFPLGGMTLINNVNVTVQNNDVVPLSGLTIEIKLFKQDKINQIGTPEETQTGIIEPGESLNVTAWVLTGVGEANRTLGGNLTDAVCVATLIVGDRVLDKFTQPIS